MSLSQKICQRMPAGSMVILLSLGVLGSAIAKESSDEDKAKALYATYLAERKDKSWGAFQRRLAALRQLGPLPCERARTSLLKVARTGKALDDRILAARGIARHGDVPSVRSLLEILGARGHPVLTQVVADGLAESEDGTVLAWLAEDALELPVDLLGPVTRAHARLAMPEAGATLREKYDAWAADAATLDLAFDALQAVGRAKAPEAERMLIDAASHSDHRIRLGASDVLALQDPEHPEVAATVGRLLQDGEAVVRRAMIAGVRSAKAERFVPDLSRCLEDDDLKTREAALDALKHLTGKDFGFDGGAWRRWWEKRDTPNPPEPYTVPTYHGIPIDSERVVFILDRSGSMRWPHKPNVVCRMDVTRDALVKVLGELPEGTLFNIVAFDSKVDPWRKGEAKTEPKTVGKAIRWVQRQEAKRGALTNTYGVLERTFAENPEIDTIYFLSDGIPEDGEITTREGLLAAIRDWNRYRRVTIHAIALTLQLLHPGKYPITGTMRRAAAFMKEVAAAGGGRYQHVERPPPSK